MCIDLIELAKPKISEKTGIAVDTVPCGKCVKCKSKRQNSWVFRLLHEAYNSSSMCFVTITYADPPLSKNGLPTLVKSHAQKFIKRIRKHISDHYLMFGYKSEDQVPTIKYYLCGEYGDETHRPHYHALFYNLPQAAITQDYLFMRWQQNGLIHVVPTGNEAIARYVSKYIMKDKNETFEFLDETTGELIQDDRQPQFPLQSKGLGKSFLTPHMVKYLRNRCATSIPLNGRQQPIPRYYRTTKIPNEDDTLYTVEQQKTMWLAYVDSMEADFKKMYRSNEHREQWRKHVKYQAEKINILQKYEAKI
jgi:hypothetical protein